MPILGRTFGKEHHARLARHGDEHAGQLLEILRLRALGGVRCPQFLLVERQAVDGNGLPVVADHLRTARGIGRDRHDPRRLTHQRFREPTPAAAHARRAWGDERARLERIDVEQRVEGDRAIGVRCGGLGKVDDDPRFLAAVQAHDAPDALLVHAAAGGRGKVHADGGARCVPALSEQLRVDEHVDVAALVGRERLGELARRRATGHGLGLEANRTHGGSDTARVVNAGRVNDARPLAEHIEVVHRGGHVDGVVVERVGKLLLVVVAADQTHPFE